MITEWKTTRNIQTYILSRSHSFYDVGSVVINEIFQGEYLYDKTEMLKNLFGLARYGRQYFIKMEVLLHFVEIRYSRRAGRQEIREPGVPDFVHVEHLQEVTAGPMIAAHLPLIILKHACLILCKWKPHGLFAIRIHRSINRSRQCNKHMMCSHCAWRQ